MLYMLDYLLFTVHTIITFGNLLGWIWKRTRRVHLVVMAATLVSWFVLGIWKGWGYCILTDWEWDIKRQLGEENLPHSFTCYLANNILHLQMSPQLVDGLTVGGLVIGMAGAVIVNFPFGVRKSKV